MKNGQTKEKQGASASCDVAEAVVKRRFASHRLQEPTTLIARSLEV